MLITLAGLVRMCGLNLWQPIVIHVEQKCSVLRISYDVKKLLTSIEMWSFVVVLDLNII